MDEIFLSTLSGMGYQLLELDPYSKEFVIEAIVLGKKKQKTLEIGCGYGITAIKALLSGACLDCNDLDTKHLDHLDKELKKNNLKNYKLIAGDFRQVITDTECYSAILCSRVLHFFDGDDVVNALACLNKLLVENGRVYITVETPFLGNWSHVFATYWENKKQGQPWPAYVATADSKNTGRDKDMPSFVNFFDIDTMVNALTQTNFTVEKISYIDRKGMFPADVLLDGRESLGVIAKKICDC